MENPVLLTIFSNGTIWEQKNLRQSAFQLKVRGFFDVIVNLERFVSSNTRN